MSVFFLKISVFFFFFLARWNLPYLWNFPPACFSWMPNQHWGPWDAIGEPTSQGSAGTSSGWSLCWFTLDHVLDQSHYMEGLPASVFLIFLCWELPWKFTSLKMERTVIFRSGLHSGYVPEGVNISLPIIVGEN